jgi:hypothetical protein
MSVSIFFSGKLICVNNFDIYMADINQSWERPLSDPAGPEIKWFGSRFR